MRIPPRALAVLTALAAAAAPVASPAQSSSDDTRCTAIAHRYFYAGFALAPTAATLTGVHRYDRRLDDVSAAAEARDVALDESTLAALRCVDPFRLSRDVAVDEKMLVAHVEDDLLLVRDLKLWRHNPDLYVGLASGSVFGLMERDCAPLRVRMNDATAREEQVPHMLETAASVLRGVDATTQGIAADDARGAVAFFTGSVPQAFAGAGTPVERARFRRANAGAAAAMRRYAAAIAAIKPSGTYAIGAAAYQRRLHLEDDLSYTIPQYLAVGNAAIDRSRAHFIATSRLIDPKKTPLENLGALQKIHPAPGRLDAVAQGDLVKLRQFLVVRHIVTVPADSNIRVVDTPPFERATTTASMDSPGPLEHRATRAYYNVTPVDARWDAARKQGFLAQFNDDQFSLISAHEVYPGHYLNYIVDKGLDLSLTRKLLWNVEFGEGWAHYGEQMMVDEGWGNRDPRVRLTQLSEALLRECRYVAGVELHAQGRSVSQVERMFEDRCFQPKAVAIEETLRGTQDPMYGYYTLGKLMILKLRSDYRKLEGPSYTLQRFHDALLAHGDPSVPILRMYLLGAADDGRPL